MSQDFYRNLLDSIADGVYFVNLDHQITFWNRGAERISGYASAEVLGTRCSDNILVHINQDGEKLCTGSCLLDKATNKAMRFSESVYLHHKDGQRIPVFIHVSPITNEAGRIIGAVEVFRKAAPENIDTELLEDLRKAALLDPLTEIANRRFLETKLKAAHEEMCRHDIGYGVIFSDIDYFKQINDTYGHSTGDEILKMVASTLACNIRSNDLVGRWGGEEFIIIVTHVDQNTLAKVAKKLHILIANSFLYRQGAELHVTMSCGVVMAERNDSQNNIIGRADTLLLRAKAEGRNRIIMEE